MASQGSLPGRLRIVIGCDTFPPDINGAARFAERLAGGLARRGHDVHIIAPGFDDSWGTFTEVHDGASMTVHRVRSYKLPQHETLRFVWPFTLKHRTDKLLKQIQPDVVHIQSHLIMGRYLVRSARQLGIRLIATNHIMPENLIKYSVIIPKFFEKTAMRMAWGDAGRVLRKVDAVTTPTRRAAELLGAATGIENIHAISCGIDASRFANSSPTSNKSPRILFLGRLDYEKHIHNLLKAVAKLPKELNTIVELVGKGGEQGHLEQLASELGIRDQVIFFGHISEEELPKAYERCTVFAMPSIAELQSIATMEAMASGRPVVAADAMALPHLVHDGDNGYLFPPDDIDVFADRLKRVLTADEAELERLSENSLYLIQAHDIQRTLTIFEDLYRAQSVDSEHSRYNLPEYNEPIGRLNETLHEQVQTLRERAAALANRVEDVRENLKDKIEDAREDVLERLEDVRDEVKTTAKRVNKKVRSTVSKAKKRMQGND
jgi:glycosyltransferase involved in cell wall biosynthesis/gas vesicle protein